MKQLKQLQRKPRKNSEASTGFQPMTSAMLYQLSYEASLRVGPSRVSSIDRWHVTCWRTTTKDSSLVYTVRSTNMATLALAFTGLVLQYIIKQFFSSVLVPELLNIPGLVYTKGRITRYDFVAYNLLTTRLRHFLGHDCRKVLKHVLKSYDFFSCRKRCRKEAACDKIVPCNSALTQDIPRANKQTKTLFNGLVYTKNQY